MRVPVPSWLGVVCLVVLSLRKIECVFYSDFKVSLLEQSLHWMYVVSMATIHMIPTASSVHASQLRCFSFLQM